METTPAGQGPSLTGNVLFYRKPEPLSLEAHGKIGVKKLISHLASFVRLTLYL